MFKPVPPCETGTVVQSIERFPEDVIGSGDTVRKGVVEEREIEVTVPEFGVVNSRAVPEEFTARVWDGRPREVRPVPPEEIGIGCPEKEISKEPDEVIEDGDTLRNSGTVIDTDVTVPVPLPSTQPSSKGVSEITERI